MLLLSRKEGEEILLPDLGIRVEVVRIHGNRVRLGVTAPREIAVHRSELLSPEARLPSTGGAGKEKGSRAGPPPRAARRNGAGERRLARIIAERTGGRLRDLEVERRDGRLIVHGSASSFYVLQLVQAAVCEALGEAGPQGAFETEFDIHVDG